VPSIKYELTPKTLVYSKDHSKVFSLAALIKEVKASEIHGYQAFPIGVAPVQLQVASSGQLALTGCPGELMDVQEALNTIPHMKLCWVFTFAPPKLTPRGLALYSDKQILLKAGEKEQLPV
jgi:hypothetical protein